MAMKANAKKAAEARARMAKRAKRARFWKENKKRITMLTLFFFLLTFLALFTPFGTDWYYGKIQNMKRESTHSVAPGVIRELYKLGVFYSYTFRKTDALRCYDEIATLYYGFTFKEYAENPADAFDKRRNAEARKTRGEILGPPFPIQDDEIRYIGYAIWRYGEIIMYGQSKFFTQNIYEELYIDDILAKFPQYCDDDVTTFVRNYVDRMRGNR